MHEAFDSASRVDCITDVLSADDRGVNYILLLVHVADMECCCCVYDITATSDRGFHGRDVEEVHFH